MCFCHFPVSAASVVNHPPGSFTVNAAIHNVFVRIIKSSVCNIIAGISIRHYKSCRFIAVSAIFHIPQRTLVIHESIIREIYFVVFHIPPASIVVHQCFFVIIFVIPGANIAVCHLPPCSLSIQSQIRQTIIFFLNTAILNQITFFILIYQTGVREIHLTISHIPRILCQMVVMIPCPNNSRTGKIYLSVCTHIPPAAVIRIRKQGISNLLSF